MDREQDYELVGEDVGTDPATYGVLEDDGEEVGPTEFGYKRGELPEEPDEIPAEQEG